MRKKTRQAGSLPHERRGKLAACRYGSNVVTISRSRNQTLSVSVLAAGKYPGRNGCVIKLLSRPADKSPSSPNFSASSFDGAMIEVSVYYCWGCDAHRRAEADSEGKARCPRCDRELTADSRLPIRAVPSPTAEGALKIVWPAPVRPRYAASA